MVVAEPLGAGSEELSAYLYSSKQAGQPWSLNRAEGVSYVLEGPEYLAVYLEPSLDPISFELLDEGGEVLRTVTVTAAGAGAGSSDPRS